MGAPSCFSHRDHFSRLALATESSSEPAPSIDLNPSVGARGAVTAGASASAFSSTEPDATPAGSVVDIRSGVTAGETATLSRGGIFSPSNDPPNVRNVAIADEERAVFFWQRQASKDLTE